MTHGVSNPTKAKEKNIADLQNPQEETKKFNILEIDNEQLNFSEIDFRNVSPEIVLSQVTQVLNLMDNCGWWYATTTVKTEGGDTLVRITISPPDGYKLSLIEKEDFKELKISSTTN